MSIITISESAQQHFKKLLANQPEGTQIRVFVMDPGTPSAECGVSYCPADTVEDNDIEEKYTDFSVYIDEFSAPFLEETVIDYVTDEFGAQLTLKAPNSKMKKVADDAPLIERVNLVELTDDNYAILQFGGGCNGCSMVDYTLKEGIEKQLMVEFPELAGVKDITEHQAGAHSFC